MSDSPGFLHNVYCSEDEGSVSNPSLSDQDHIERDVFGSDSDSDALPSIGSRLLRRDTSTEDIACAPDQSLSSAMGDACSPPRNIGSSSSAGSRITRKGMRKTSREWNVSSIVVGDGSVGKSGHRLGDGCYFGSSSLHADNSSFHGIDPDSLSLCEHTAERVTWAIRPETERAKRAYGRRSEGIDPASVLHRDDPDGKIADLHLDELWNWCEAFPGVAVLIGGPMARPPSAKVAPFLLEDLGALVRNNDNATGGNCLEDSIVNAISSLFGRHEAVAATELENIRDGNLTNIKGVTRVVHKLSVDVEVRRLPKHVKKASHRKEICLFNWLSECAKGVWLVRLVQSGVVDHCVSVDTKEAIILESAEMYPLKLLEDVLRMCGGDDADDLKIAEACQPALQ